MAYEQILYEVAGRIATVTFNRPQYRNAQSRVLREELDDAFAVAVADPEVRVIVLAGAGEHWSSGHDLGTPDELADQQRRPYADGVLGTHKRSWDLNVENSLRWRDLPKPTIASVQGYCIFGGWIIAAAMDLIVAAEDAMFLPGHTQYFSAPWDVGPKKAKEILFQSRFVDAHEAERLGFVNMVVPRDRLAVETAALAERIAETDSYTLRVVKDSVNRMQDAMGYRNAIVNAHSNYMLLQQSGRIRGRGDGPTKRLPGVDQALRKAKT